jgi:hypothetical protein
MEYDLLTRLDKTIFVLPFPSNDNDKEIFKSEFDLYANATCTSELAFMYGVQIDGVGNYGKEDKAALNLLKTLLMFLSEKFGLNIPALEKKNYNPEKLKKEYKKINSGTWVLPKIYDTKEELEGFFMTRARGEYEKSLSTNPENQRPKKNSATAQNAQRQGTAVAGTNGTAVATVGGSHPQKKTHKCSDGVTRTVYTINGKRYVKRKSPKTNTYIYVKI